MVERENIQGSQQDTNIHWTERQQKNVTETSQASALCELVESSDEEATNYVDVDNIPLGNVSLSNYNSSNDYGSDPDNISLLM